MLKPMRPFPLLHMLVIFSHALHFHPFLSSNTQSKNSVIVLNFKYRQFLFKDNLVQHSPRMLITSDSVASFLLLSLPPSSNLNRPMKMFPGFHNFLKKESITLSSHSFQCPKMFTLLSQEALILDLMNVSLNWLFMSQKP